MGGAAEFVAATVAGLLARGVPAQQIIGAA
jgi:hypothetical protein